MKNYHSPSAILNDNKDEEEKELPGKFFIMFLTASKDGDLKIWFDDQSEAEVAFDRIVRDIRAGVTLVMLQDNIYMASQYILATALVDANMQKNLGLDSK